VSTLKDLTIIIPTYKRTEYIKRSIGFWNEKEVNVLILDGSEKSIMDSEDLIIASNIKYIHSFTTIFNRLNIAMDIVDTKYCVLLGDDEFFTPSALEKAITFLDTHPSYVACGGQCISFSKSTAGGIDYRLRYPKFLNLDLSVDDASLRVISHFENYTCAHIYSIMRTNVWKRAVWPLTQSDFSAYGAGELAFEFIASYMGKCKLLPILYWFRSAENSSNLSSEKSTNPAYRFEIWWKEKKYAPERERFQSLVFQALQVNEQHIDIKATFDLAFKGYYLNSVRPQVSSVIRKVLSRIKLFRLIKTVILNKSSRKINFDDMKDTSEYVEILHVLQSGDVYVDKASFGEITKIVLDFHNSKSKFFN
jgi:glycosyltransferase domain-containing protein